MSRKDKSFAQLLQYMEKDADADDHIFRRNLFSRNRDDIEKEFSKNAEFLKNRKNRNYLYHEVISILKQKDLSSEHQKNALLEIANKYAEKRCANNLVVGFIHDKGMNNIHIHLMISSNEYENDKSLRLSKADFDSIKKEIENYTLEKYPELNQGKVINKKAVAKTSNKGGELKRRKGKLSERGRVESCLKNIFSKEKTKNGFFEKMSAENLELYKRGKSLGVVDTQTGRKYRLGTLGLEEEFKLMSDRIDLERESIKKQSPGQEKKKEAPKPKEKKKSSQEAKTKLSEEELKIKRAKEELKETRVNQKSKNNEKSKK